MWLHREDSVKRHLQSLLPVLPEVDNDLPLEMETSRQNANRSSKNTLRLKPGAWRDSDTVFTTRWKWYPRRLLLSILEAMFTVSPNRQYLGIVVPTTPATTAPAEGRTDGQNQSAFQRIRHHGTHWANKGNSINVEGQSLAIPVDFRNYKEANYRTRTFLVENNITSCYGLNACICPMFACWSPNLH